MWCLQEVFRHCWEPWSEAHRFHIEWAIRSRPNPPLMHLRGIWCWVQCRPRTRRCMFCSGRRVQGYMSSMRMTIEGHSHPNNMLLHHIGRTASNMACPEDIYSPEYNSELKLLRLPPKRPRKLMPEPLCMREAVEIDARETKVVERLATRRPPLAMIKKGLRMQEMAEKPSTGGCR